MYAIDLFEADPQSGYVPVNPERPGSKHRKLGNLNLDAIKKSFEQPGAPKPATLQFLNGTSRTLTSAEVDAVADYYDSLKTKVERANFIYRTFVSQDKMSNLLFKLKQLSLDLPPPREPDAGPEQLTLFQEKKSFDKPKYKDVNVQRAVRQAQADFPTAASDDEAFIKSMMVQQDQDQKNIDRLKTGLTRQKELLNKNDQLDQTQDQTINDLNKEIHTVEKDNDNLQLSLQQMQRANAELQQTLDRMRGKRTEPAPQLGVSVATDKQPAVEPAPTTTQPANVATRRDLAKIAQRQRAIGRTIKQKQLDTEKSLGTAQVGGQDAGVYQSLKQTELPATIKKNQSFTDVDELPTSIKREDLTHGLEEGSVFGQQDFDTQMDLAKLKTKLTQPKPAQGAPVAEPQPVPARLSDLQSRREKFANLADIKKEIERLQAQATRGGRILPRGLAADLEDYFTTADVDRDYEEMLAKYQKQLGALQQYLGMRKVLWSPKKDVHEMRANELQETKESKAWEEGGREGYYHRPNKNPYKPGTQEHSDYNRGYEHFKGDKDWGTPKRRPVPEDTKSEFKAAALNKIKKALSNPKLDPSVRKDYETRLKKIQDLEETKWKKETPWVKSTGKDPRGEVTHMSDIARKETERREREDSPMGQLFKDFEKVFGKKPPVKEGDVVNINRGGYNQFRDKNDFLDKRDYIQQQLLDPRQRDNHAELKQRLQDINYAGRKLGYI